MTSILPGEPSPPPTSAGNGTRFFDISLPLRSDSPPTIPGDPSFSRELFLRPVPDGCEAAVLRMSAHTGTHLDFPAHFLPKGKRAGDYAPQAFFPPAVVVDCGATLSLGPEVLAGTQTHPGQAVLLRTRNSFDRLFQGSDFPTKFAAATTALAQECARRKLSLIGLDALSIEPLTDPHYPVHHILLAAGILILEGLILDAVPPGLYRLACPPLNIPDAEATPVRAILLPAWP